MKKFALLGYYGFGNYGDDAVLKHVVNLLRSSCEEPEIFVFLPKMIVSPTINELGDITPVERFNFEEIFTTLAVVDCLILGGGSLLQNATSLRSLLYYLFIIFVAKLYHKKVIILGQGIGPLKGFFSKNLTFNLLKTINLITVRDEKSEKLLENNGIRSYLTSDLLWGLDIEPFKKENDSDEIRVGVQLRTWKGLSYRHIKELAEALCENFDITKTVFRVISLHSALDFKECEVFMKAMRLINPNVKLEFYDEKTINLQVEKLVNLDYLVAMRFHAGVSAVKAGIPLIMISYDPKVDELCNKATVPCVKINALSKELLSQNISKIINFRAQIIDNMNQVSSEMAEMAQRNENLLKSFLNKYKDVEF